MQEISSISKSESSSEIAQKDMSGLTYDPLT
jgi:hypothetical protein